MDADVLFAGVAVSDFNSAQAGYARYVRPPPDVVAHDEEVMWQATERGWLYIVRDCHSPRHRLRGAVWRYLMEVADDDGRIRITASTPSTGDSSMDHLRVTPRGWPRCGVSRSGRCGKLIGLYFKSRQLLSRAAVHESRRRRRPPLT
jgi:hypothetical protein